MIPFRIVTFPIIEYNVCYKKYWKEGFALKKKSISFSMWGLFFCDIPILLSYFILVPLSSFISVAFTLSIEKIVNAALDTEIMLLIYATTTSAVFALLDIVASLLRCRIRIKLIEKCIHALRCELLNGIMTSTSLQVNKQSLSTYTSVLTNDINRLRDSYFSSICDVYESLCSFVSAMLTMLFYSPIIGVFLLIVGAFSINIPKLFASRLRRVRASQMEKAKDHLSSLYDIFGGYWVIKKHHLESRFVQNYTDVSANLAYADYLDSFYPSKVSTISASFTTIAYIGVISISVYSVMTGRLDIGIVLSLSQLIGGILMPIETIPHYLSRLEGARQIRKEIGVFLGSSEVQNKREYLLQSGWRTMRIEFSGFAYPGSSVPIISKTFLEIEQGKKYAIIGRSGSGKSTIARIMAGLFPSAFNLFVDGKKIDPSALSNRVSYMDQNIFLFNDSIYQNISLYRNIDRSVVRNILDSMRFEKVSTIDSDVLEIMVGENGANLSGGERQRIALARELINPHEIFILDEYTSNLDPKTARMLDEIILGLENVTCILITHQFDSLLLHNCDKVFSLEDGHLIELKSSCTLETHTS